MSTRSVIARKNKTGFTGTYHHWDGMPTCLGATLYKLWNGYFQKNTEKMLSILIDAHPGGWSTINGGDFTLDAGYDSNYHEKDSHGPQCYCHGERTEGVCAMTEKNSSDCGCEWAYAFHGDYMDVLSSYCENGDKMIGAFGCGDPNADWRLVATVDLNETEPNWKKIESSTQDFKTYVVDN